MATNVRSGEGGPPGVSRRARPDRRTHCIRCRKAMAEAWACPLARQAPTAAGSGPALSDPDGGRADRWADPCRAICRGPACQLDALGAEGARGSGPVPTRWPPSPASDPLLPPCPGRPFPGGVELGRSGPVVRERREGCRLDHHARPALRRLGHAALAPVAQELPQAVRAAPGRGEPVPGLGAPADRGRRSRAPVVVTADAFRFIVAEQLAAAGIEPARAPGGARGARHRRRRCWPRRVHGRAREDPDALLLVAPSDHVIPETPGFRAAVAAAVPAAEAGRIVTFGIRPDRPETGYGYLELPRGPGRRGAGAPAPARASSRSPTPSARRGDGRGRAAPVERGLFLFRADVHARGRARAHAPALLAAVEAAVAGARRDLGFCRLDPAAWARAPAISIDYAVMEKAANLSVMPYDGTLVGPRRLGRGLARDGEDGEGGQRPLGPGHRHRLRGHAPARRGARPAGRRHRPHAT